MWNNEIGWLKEMRALCDLVKSLPNELKAVPKEGVDIGVEAQRPLCDCQT